MKKPFDINSLSAKDRKSFDEVFPILLQAVTEVAGAIDFSDDPSLFSQALYRAYRGEAVDGEQDVINEDSVVPKTMELFKKVVAKL